MAAKTPYPGGERALQPLSPLSKKDEILALLESHGAAVEIHTNREPEYADGFWDEDVILVGRNPHEGGGDVEIWLQDEFTLSFGGWHRHDFPYVADYEDGFLANLRGFLDGTVLAAAAFGPDHWVASQTFKADSLPRTREEALAGMRLHAEHRRMVESPGGRIELANWDPAKNVVFRW